MGAARRRCANAPCLVAGRCCPVLAQRVHLLATVMGFVRAVRSPSGHPGPASWTSLVAETGGFSAISVLTVRVLAACALPEGSRLVVHEVRANARAGELPLASLQRVVAREGLTRGLELQLFRVRPTPGGATRLEAWIDTRGNEELEFDGVHAEPTDAALVGAADVHHDRATLVLEPRVRRPIATA
jgi:hypothetical protein